jgi:hypothetical protein
LTTASIVNRAPSRRPTKHRAETPLNPPSSDAKLLGQPVASATDRRADVYALAAAWRSALEAAESALGAARESLPPAELSLRHQRLVTERGATLRLLQAVAREQGVSTRFLHLVPPHDLRRVLDLPSSVSACVFELEGVLVAGAELHIAAWQQTFDEFLLRRQEVTPQHVPPFHSGIDYPRHMYGRPRLEGVTTFLASRGISLPYGAPSDPPGAATV